MLDLNNLKIYITSSDVNILVTRISEFLLISIWSTFLYKKEEIIHCLLGVCALANMTRRSFNFTFTRTFIALNLDLLLETRSKPSCLDSHALTVALGALFDVRGVVSTRASAVRTDDLSCVFYFHFFANIQVRKRNPYLDSHTWASLLLLMTKTSTEHVKDISESSTASSFWLVNTLFSTSIVFSPFIWITKDFICS